MADLICFLLAVFGQLLVRESKGSLLGIELDETGQKFLNEYLSLNDGKYLAKLQEFEDTAIELDLIDRKRKHRPIHEPPRVLYQIGESEDELPECSDRSEVCSKVDLYGSPWVERQCRCPDGRTCPSSLHGDDGHTIVDKTRQYKLCEPVKRLPICRYFKLVAIVRLIESIHQVAERSNRRHMDSSSWRGSSERDGSASLLPMSARQRTLSSSKASLQVFRGKPRIYLCIRVLSAKQTTLSAQGTLSTVHREKETELAARRGKRVASLSVSERSEMSKEAHRSRFPSSKILFRCFGNQDLQRILRTFAVASFRGGL